MVNSIRIEITIEDDKLRFTVISAIKMEQEASNTKKSKLFVKETNDSIVIEIKTVDITTSRALFNSIMRLIKTSLEIASTDYK